MERKYGLSQAEYEIMELFWSVDEALGFKEILQYFNEEKGKDWKKQTVGTFLKILQDKQMIIADKSGTKYKYRAIHTKEEHAHLWIRQLIRDSFEDSIGKFLAAFSGEDKLGEKDAQELRDYLKKYESNDSDQSGKDGQSI